MASRSIHLRAAPYRAMCRPRGLPLSAGFGLTGLPSTFDGEGRAYAQTMLVTVQLPFADVRHFLARDTTGQLPLMGAFTTLTPNQDFIRAFGPLRRRRRGGVSSWPGEELYADARRALRYADRADGEESEDDWWTQSRKQSAFRRLLSDGTATTRVEAGIAVDLLDPRREPSAKEVALRVLGISSRVPNTEGGFVQSSLGSAGTPLAKHFLRSTTAVKSQVDAVPSWWCRTGPPAVLIEAPDLEPPRHAVAPVAGLESQGVRLYHWYENHEGSEVDVWLMDNSEAGYGVARRVRIHILRLHAEWQVLRAILGLLAQEKFAVVPRTDHSDRLQMYLNQKTHLIERRRLDGMPQSELLAAAYRTDELSHEGERASLRAALEKIRPNLRRKLEEVTSTIARPRVLVLAANPANMDKLALGRENTTIHKALRSGLGEDFQFNSFWSVDPDDVRELVKHIKPHIVHFAAHADEVGEIVFENDQGQAQPVPVDALAELFRLHAGVVRCVVLNACASIDVAEAISQHVDVVLGTTRQVFDSDALGFAQALYQSLAEGDNFKRAYEHAVNALSINDRPHVTELLVRPSVDASSLTLTSISSS